MKKYMGCPVPDTDEDGVNDENDKCPTQEGTIKYAGCPVPDKDKDGIPDDKDKCPGNSGLTRYDGCPIPDSDHDGVNDEEDKCPNFAGVSSNKGCVDFQPIVDKATSNLKFASGKIDLLKKQLTPLNEVVALLKDNPTVRIVINGHTDNTGSRNINDKLSLQRAKVVQRFVLSKGIDQNRVSIMGYADTKPISDNATLKGRAENRRTDITVLYN
jgi:outer membrane protein OmpA-like peptidoglycan-associated protein